MVLGACTANCCGFWIFFAAFVCGPLPQYVNVYLNSFGVRFRNFEKGYILSSLHLKSE